MNRYLTILQCAGRRAAPGMSAVPANAAPHAAPEGLQ